MNTYYKVYVTVGLYLAVLLGYFPHNDAVVIWFIGALILVLSYCYQVVTSAFPTHRLCPVRNSNFTYLYAVD